MQELPPQDSCHWLMASDAFSRARTHQRIGSVWLKFQSALLPDIVDDYGEFMARGSDTEWYTEVDGDGKEGNRANSLRRASPGGRDTEWWTEVDGDGKEGNRANSLRKASLGGSDTDGWTEVDGDGKEETVQIACGKLRWEGAIRSGGRRERYGGVTEWWTEVDGDGKEGSRANSLRKASPGGSDTEGWAAVDGDGKEENRANSLRKASPGGSDTEGWAEVDGDGKEGNRANSLRKASPGGRDTEWWMEMGRKETAQIACGKLCRE
eukprot:s4902_g2.t1